MLSDRDAVVAELARCDVLVGATYVDLQDLAAFLTPFMAPPGTVLIRRGDVAEHFMLVIAGQAKVVFGEEGAQKVTVVAEGSILGEMALLRGRRRASTVTAVTEMRGLRGGRVAFSRLLAIAGVPDRVVTKARQRLAAGMIPVPLTLRDGTSIGLRPIYPDDRWRLMQAGALVSPETLYRRFFITREIGPAMARYLTEIDYIDHFTWVAVDSADVSVGGATYVRSASGSALADISFGIMDQFQGRGLGTLLMGAIAVAARRNGISRFSADVLAENTPMCAILDRAGIEWEPVKLGVAHGTLEVPDPGTFGIPPMTAAALSDAADEVAIRAWHSLATRASPLPPPGTC